MKTQSYRLQAIDVVRGLAVILMITTHIWISFFWSNTNILGTILSYLGGYLSFSIFLLVSGFTLGIGHHKQNLRKITYKSFVLLAIYAGLGILYSLLKKQDIFSLFTSPIYLEEYLLTLAIFPVIAYFITKFIQRLSIVKRILLHSIGAFVVLLLGFGFVLLGKYTATINTSFILSLFVGSTAFHTFPFLSYFVIYAMGIWLGWSYKQETPKQYGSEAVATILVSTLISFISLPLENISFSLQNLDAIRWPPTLFFISSGLAIASALVYGATLIEQHFKKPVWKFFEYIGKQALLFFVLHLVFIYLIQGIVLAKVSEIPTPTATPTPVSRLAQIAQDLGKATQYDESWPFNGYKVAIIPIPQSSVKKQYHVEINAKDIGALGALQDVTLAAISKDGSITKISKNFVSFKNNVVTVNFTAEPNYESISISVSDLIAQPSLNSMLDIAAKDLDSSGSLLVRLNSSYENWIYKPFAISGQRWFVKNVTESPTKTLLSTYFPISCDDFDYYLGQLHSTLAVEFDGQTISYSLDCTPLPDILQKKYPAAKSIITLPLALDLTKQKDVKKEVHYTVGVPNINGEPAFTIEFIKNIAISEPMFVAWTYDWDAINGTGYLDKVTAVRNQLTGIPVTHFFNPRIWNSGSISKASADTQIAFVKNGQSKSGDEVALHLHMFTDMLSKAGVAQSSSPGWGKFGNGYDIPFSEFSYEDSKRIILWSLNEFKLKGLPKPNGIRAGGWLMDLDNLKAAKDSGISYDSSARTAFTTASFNSQGHKYTGYWNIQLTTQPYWISSAGQNISTSKSKSIGLYEIPNNGADSWAYSKETLFSRFRSNYGGEILSTPRIVTYLSHPDFFGTEQPHIQPVLVTIATLQAKNDAGPIVFTTLNKYYTKYANR